MATEKAGTILLDLENKKIALVFRDTFSDYSFPKGHLELNETFAECAVRETEEETLQANHIYLLKMKFILFHISHLRVKNVFLTTI